jgi:transcriptional regulator with XRE-family HTH domain
MPRKSRSKLPPPNLADEPLGQRLARFRKERGYTQLELSEKTGVLRELISDYERGRLRPNYEIIIRFALALEVSADELLGIKPSTCSVYKPSLKILRRMKKIEALPDSQQKFILKTIDSHLKALEK